MNGSIALLRRPALWFAATAMAGATALAVGNGWVAGATLVTLLIAAAPCLVMCALGLCMKGGAGTTCDRQAGGRSFPADRSGDPDPR